MSAGSSTASPAARRAPGGMPGKALRYVGGSIVAAGCSEVTLVLLYGLLHVAPGPASCLAWLAGAVPNYWLNRSWTWRRRGRPDLHREVLPYVAIVVATLGLATLATAAVDRWSRNVDTGSMARVVLVAGTFLAVYVGMFVLRFALFDRLFTRLERSSRAAADEQVPQ
jgi:putative flippase GtrA